MYMKLGEKWGGRIHLDTVFADWFSQRLRRHEQKSLIHPGECGHAHTRVVGQKWHFLKRKSRSEAVNGCALFQKKEYKMVSAWAVNAGHPVCVTTNNWTL